MSAWPSADGNAAGNAAAPNLPRHMAEKKPKKASRTRRLAGVATVVGGQGAKTLATTAANTMRSEEKAAAANQKRALEVAEQLVTLLGTMRGAAMKVGQTLSVTDFGLIPEENREEFQQKLASLQDNAPKVPWKKMKAQIEKGLGDKIDSVFAEFDEEPVAAASIGQVYRARLDSGQEVAVKVQYPGIAQTVRADIKNLRLFAPAAKGLFPGIDLNSIIDEAEERVLEELDYEHEAQNHRTIARAYRGHPFIRVPDVHTSLCSEVILVSDWLEGKPLASAYEADQETRNRVSEILFRFTMGAPYVSRCFSGDPHPGNALVLTDGTLGFIDFGLAKTISAADADMELAAMRALRDRDGETLIRLARAKGLEASEDRITPEEIMDALMISQGWYLTRGVSELTNEIANDIAGRSTDPRSPVVRVFKGESLPVEHLVQRRVEILTLSTLGLLRPKLDFGAIMSEWIDGAEPVSELGRLEAEWHSARGL